MHIAGPDQLDMLSLPQAAPQSRPGDAPPSLSAGQQAGVQQLIPAPRQTDPPMGGEAAALPPLPRLPAVTTASLPQLAEVLAPVALPAASCLIGAAWPLVCLETLLQYHNPLLYMLMVLSY